VCGGAAVNDVRYIMDDDAEPRTSFFSSLGPVVKVDLIQEQVQCTKPDEQCNVHARSTQ
jgi:hypothetical protein